MIKHVWIEWQAAGFDPLRDNIDVVVETEDGMRWQASFVTIPYLQRQMQTSHEVARGIINMPPIRFVTIETPHVIVDVLDTETIEDTIDNLMTLGVFESVFTRQVVHNRSHLRHRMPTSQAAPDTFPANHRPATI